MYTFVISEVDDGVSSGYKPATITLGVLLGLFVTGFSAVMGLFLEKMNVCKKGDDKVDVRNVSIEMNSDEGRDDGGANDGDAVGANDGDICVDSDIGAVSTNDIGTNDIGTNDIGTNDSDSDKYSDIY